MADDDDIEYDGDLQAFEYLNESFEPDDMVASEVEEDPSLAPKKYEGVGDAKTVEQEDILSLKVEKTQNTLGKSAELGIEDFFDNDGPVSGKDGFANILKDPVSSAAADASNPFPLPLTPPSGTRLPEVRKSNPSSQKRQPKSPRSHKKEPRISRNKMPPLNLKKADVQHDEKEKRAGEEKQGRQKTHRKRLDLRKRREVELALAKVSIIIMQLLLFMKHYLFMLCLNGLSDAVRSTG